ncbi:unnamed protein product [Calypogeia fissa]
MLLRMGGFLMPLHYSTCVGVSIRSMGPTRHSLRVAARNLVSTLNSRPSASNVTTPRGVSNISRAKLKHLGFLARESDSEVEELSCSSEDKLASEEFNLGELQSVNLDGIKRQLNFAPSKATTMHGSNGNVKTGKTRVKVKIEPHDGVVQPSRPSRRNSKPKLSAVKIADAEYGKEHHTVNVVGVVKQEPKAEETLISPSLQHTGIDDIDDIVKTDPREEAGLRGRKKVQRNVLSRVTKVKVETDQQEEDSKKGQESPQASSRRKRKLPEHGSAGVTTTKLGSDRKRTNQVTNGAASGMELEVISVRPCSGAQLASETASAITILPGPFPTYARPFSEECQEAKELLSALHGRLPEYERHKPRQSLGSSGPVAKTRGQNHATKSRSQAVDQAINMQLALAPISSDMVQKERPRNKGAVLDSLIGTLLSQNTTDTNSRRAFASLKKSFPTWEQALQADPKELEDAIRCGGLAEVKAERIRNILSTLMKERGEISMEYIRSMSNEAIKVELSRFKGVGPKTVACVLMFHLQREEFPVDTHVFRISKMLGWVPEQADREKAYLHLNQRIPDSLKFDIHCLFVTHGKRCPNCAKRFNRQPSDGECPLINWKSRWSSRRIHAPLELEFPSGQPTN